MGLARSAYMFVGGVGLGSFPVYYMLQQQSRDSKRTILKEFQTQRDLVYMLKLKELQQAK